MKAPVYFYYELSNFFQNYQSYFDSMSKEQWGGEDISLDEAKYVCGEKATLNEEMYFIQSFSKNTTLDPKAVAFPCGYIAKTIFNGWIYNN